MIKMKNEVNLMLIYIDLDANKVIPNGIRQM